MSGSFEVVCSSDDRARWLDLRRTGIGASEIAAVLGESRWKSPLAVYAEKIGESSEQSDNEAMFWGIRLERPIVEVFGERTGRPVESSGQLLRSSEHPWAIATLDARVYPREDRWWPLEAKTSSAFKAEEWAEGPPREYYLQVQHQMLVTGTPRASIACLLGGQRLVWCDVERDEIEIRRIVHAGRAFWDRLEGRAAPSPDGSESSRAAVLDLYPSGRKVSWREQQGRVDYRKCAEALGATPDLLEKHRSKSTRVFRQHDAKES